MDKSRRTLLTLGAQARRVCMNHNMQGKMEDTARYPELEYESYPSIREVTRRYLRMLKVKVWLMGINVPSNQ